MSSADVIIIGGGIVGLATAYKLTQRDPSPRVILLEKENEVCRHQSGRNSGVLHSGIYYKPGSLKARTCVTGRRQMEQFCEREGVAWRRCGKVIAATTMAEAAALPALLDRGRANGVDCRPLDAAAVREVEPHCAGIAGIFVADTGVADFTGVCRRLSDRIRERGSEVVTRAEALAVHAIDGEVAVETPNGPFTGRHLINCSGLQSDRVARMTGDDPDVQVVPFRGEYYSLRKQAEHLCRTLIYPVPDPAFPFLGVHFTRAVEGHVHCGPNAVLAFAREGYRRSDVNFHDLGEILGFEGFRRMALKHWRMGAGEMWRSISKRAFVQSARALVPEITEDDLVPSPAGVRAMAVTSGGAMADDFLVSRRGPVTNVLNAPSPAATASLAIADLILERAGL